MILQGAASLSSRTSLVEVSFPPISKSNASVPSSVPGGRRRLRVDAVAEVPSRVRPGSRKPLSDVRRRSTGTGVSWKLACKRELALELPGTSTCVDEYLQTPERVVHVAFPDSSRLRSVRPTYWEARLKPVTFFTVTATPVCTMRYVAPDRHIENREFVSQILKHSKDLKLYLNLWEIMLTPDETHDVSRPRKMQVFCRAWYEDGALQLSSDSLHLEFIGAPEELTRVNLRLDVRGHLKPLQRHGGQPQGRRSMVRTGSPSVAKSSLDRPRSGESSRSIAGSGASRSLSCKVGGSVNLSLAVDDLPFALALIPEAAVNQVGGAILAAILDAMKGALQRGLVRDYRVWDRERKVLSGGLERSSFAA